MLVANTKTHGKARCDFHGQELQSGPARGKKKAQEEKKKDNMEKKQAEKLRKVMQTYETNNHKNERDYIVSMIDSNPGWVSKLAKVIRQGGMRLLLELEAKEAAEENVDYGDKWKGKAKTLLALPTAVMQRMVLASLKQGLSLQELEKDDDWWKKCFAYRFHCDDETPLPQHSLVKHTLVLEEFGKARVQALGHNRLEDNPKKLELMETRDFLFWRMVETQHEDETKTSKLVCALTDKAHDLPRLTSEQGPWRLSDAWSPSALVIARNCPLQFKAADYFQELASSSDRWKYEVDAVAAAKAASAYISRLHSEAAENAVSAQDNPFRRGRPSQNAR